MPDLDGFELMARLKERFPALDVILSRSLSSSRLEDE
jgi:CheY-like chemotaxis protein